MDEQKQYTYEESEIIKARTEPTMTPLQPRLLYTPADQTFLDAKLRVSDPLTMTVSPHTTLELLHDPLMLTSLDPQTFRLPRQPQNT